MQRIEPEGNPEPAEGGSIEVEGHNVGEDVAEDDGSRDAEVRLVCWWCGVDCACVCRLSP